MYVILSLENNVKQICYLGSSPGLFSTFEAAEERLYDLMSYNSGVDYKIYQLYETETSVKEEVLKCWAEVYSKTDLEDPHQTFADMTDLTCKEARALCYRIMYSMPIFKNALRGNRD